MTLSRIDREAVSAAFPGWECGMLCGTLDCIWMRTHPRKNAPVPSAAQETFSDISEVAPFRFVIFSIFVRFIKGALQIPHTYLHTD